MNMFESKEKGWYGGARKKHGVFFVQVGAYKIGSWCFHLVVAGECYLSRL